MSMVWGAGAIPASTTAHGTVKKAVDIGAIPAMTVIDSNVGNPTNVGPYGFQSAAEFNLMEVMLGALYADVNTLRNEVAALRDALRTAEQMS